MGARLLTTRTLAVALLVAKAAVGSAAAQDLDLTRVRIDSAGTLTGLARAGFEVAGVQTVNDVDFAIIVTTSAQRAALGAAGLQVVAAPTVPAAPPRYFRDFRSIDSLLGAIAAANASVFLDTIGVSFEGRPIHAVKFGTPDDAPGRANALFIGTHHAREWIAAEFAVRLIEYLADSLPATPAGASLLAARDVWVVPVLNPDGYQHTFDLERLWRKNRRPNADGSIGVDLNRNYPAFWARDDIGSSAVPAAETYRGAGPGSEPEVAALMAFHAAHPPVVAVSYHSFTNLILYPYGHAPGVLAPDVAVFTALAGTPLAPAIRDGLPESARPEYYPGPGWQLYPTNGEYTEWAYRAHGTLAFTVELTAGCCLAGAWYGFEFPDDSAAIARVVRDNLPFALAVLDAAADPTRAPSLATGARFEAAWPVVRLVGPPGPTTVPVTVGRGAFETMIPLRADSLNRGNHRWRWEGDGSEVIPGSRLEVPGLGVTIALLAAAGAEDTLDGWTGWVRDSVRPMEGRFDWRATDDTLVSPPIVLAGVDEPRVVVWTRHTGSLFQPERHGAIDLSLDDGTSWTPLGVVAGSSAEWYPVGFPLPARGDGVRLRFRSNGMAWWIDALHVIGNRPAPPVASAGALALSENPVRSDRLFFSWAPTSGDAVLSVLSFTGELVFRRGLSALEGRVEWDLRNRRGAAVHNGAYVAVLTLPRETLRRRVFVARAR